MSSYKQNTVTTSNNAVLEAVGLQALPGLLRQAQRKKLFPPADLLILIEGLAPSKTPPRAQVKELVRELERVGLVQTVYKGHQRFYRVHAEKAKDTETHLLRLDQSRQARHRLSSLEVYRRMGDRPTFTRAQLNEAFPELRLTAIDRMLTRLVKRGVLIKVAGSRGRGRYEIVPERWTPPTRQAAGEAQRPAPLADRMLAALTLGGQDAVFCYATAMELHHLCRYDVLSVVYLSGGQPFRRRTGGGIEYVWVNRPRPDLGTIVHDHKGNPIRVSDIERTLIDVLHRPRYCLEEEDILRAIELIEAVDAEKVEAYLRVLDSPPLTAKVGFFLAANADRWKIAPGILEKLTGHLPERPIYLFPGTPSCLDRRWKLRVPVELSRQPVEGPHADRDDHPGTDRDGVPGEQVP